MITVQLHLFKKIIVGVFLLVAATCSSSFAGTVVDLDQQRDYPLGEVFENKAGDQAYFSLGNGRAIKISLTESSKKEGEMLKGLVSSRVRGNMKPALAKRRNLKW